MLAIIDRAFLLIRARPFLYRFALLTRILLAAGFIPTGLVKLLGRRFTSMSPDFPIGAFFEAMFQTGLYWRFLGATQIIAGVLLLIPKLAHLGAAIFLGIMLNIFIITLSMDFNYTPVFTGLMLLAVLFLCFWDFHRFRPMLTEAPFASPIPTHRLDNFEALGFATFALCVLGVCASTRSFISSAYNLPLIVIGTLAGILTLARFLWINRRVAQAI